MSMGTGRDLSTNISETFEVHSCSDSRNFAGFKKKPDEELKISQV